MNSHVSSSLEIRRVLNATAAGATPVNCVTIDTQGYDGVCFVASFGALTAGQATSLKAQASNDDAVSDPYADVAGTLTGPLADADGNKTLVLDLFKPIKRFVRLTVNRATANAAIDGVVALLYRAEKTPTPRHTTCSAVKLLYEPPLGTP